MDCSFDHLRDSPVPFDLRELAEFLSVWVGVQRTSPHFQRARISALGSREELLGDYLLNRCLSGAGKLQFIPTNWDGSFILVPPRENEE